MRKIDPGEKFPWEYLAKNRIGIWHNHKSIFLKKIRKVNVSKKADFINFLNNLSKIGYYSKYKKKFFLFKLIKAFQRHFRKELINGFLDKECLVISQNLIKKL